ncbi:uncharacterized protein A1O5_11927 [Cladophialophora psammophila CBS 110553]|uniref:Transketolase N-terminal domain-containing protein n=1 Tax=Cladophialophora psammophila CBS 110553 TaxID=1182543 RepID=W9WST0_9EURO|nr:uncharacterized protein A1O5_11927 [Cladophialophora psammophila CBS 110553]EXJ61369.1 hypothetical protein A1O5_11927 [Cladophialophora psammophila CBS 110553]
MPELKGYGSAKANGYKTIGHGHPEIEVPGVEVTTPMGSLGQGIANAVGYLRDDILILIYDNNAVTCGGPLDWINSEDVNAKMRVCSRKVLEIGDGSYDV